MADKKGCFVTPEEIDEFLDLASDFKVSNTSDKSEDECKSLVLLIVFLRDILQFWRIFLFLRKKFFGIKNVFFFCLLFALLKSGYNWNYCFLL